MISIESVQNEKSNVCRILNSNRKKIPSTSSKKIQNTMRLPSSINFSKDHHRPQLFMAFPLRLNIVLRSEMWLFANRIFDGEYKVVHSCWNVKVWQSGAPYRHYPFFLSCVFLTHSWNTRPKDKHRALSHATTPYSFPIKTIQCRRSEMWLFANRIFDGEYKVVHSFWNVKVWQSGAPYRH